MLAGHEMIARVDIAVVLQDHDIAAGFAKNAQRVRHSPERPRRLIEILDADPLDIVADPLVEHRCTSDLNPPIIFSSRA
jgi:hypothetical protein